MAWMLTEVVWVYPFCGGPGSKGRRRGADKFWLPCCAKNSFEAREIWIWNKYMQLGKNQMDLYQSE